MENLKNTLWGLVFIIVGLIFGLNALDITNINIFFDGWWTLFIIVPCFINLFKDEDKIGNIIGLLIGISLLLASLDLIDFSLIFKLLFPAILVVIGLSFIFKDKVNEKINSKIKELNKNKKNEQVCSTFSEQNIEYDNEVFTGCNMDSIFGGIKCDLRSAVINEDVIINATAIFGGIDIIVPKDIKVKVKSTSIFGGVSNKSKNKKNDDTKTIYINATCIFGGVEVK